MDPRDVKLVKDLEKVAKGIRRTGLTLVVAAPVVSVLTYVGEDWSKLTAAAVLGVVTLTGVRMTAAGHAVVKEINAAALNALFTARRTP